MMLLARLSAAFVLIGLALASIGRAAKEEAPVEPKAVPTFGAIGRAVRKHFAKEKDHAPTDILSRGQVEPLFEKLEKLGWTVKDRAAILKELLADDDQLVRELRTTAGRRFMRQAAAYDGAYDRIDRMRDLPKGNRMVRDLIAGKDGYKMLEYMSTTPGGKKLGKQLSSSPGAKGFNEPTGRIYTIQQLVARLRESHAEAMAEVDDERPTR